MKTLNDQALSLIGFGGASLSSWGGGYGFGPISEEQELLETAYDLGVNLYDTAPFYGYGQSEETLSVFIKNKRQDLFIVNKGGLTWDHSKRFDIINTPVIYEKMLQDSLKKLKTDYIDLYMVHHSSKEDIRYVAEFLAKKKEKNMIRYLGFCNLNLEEAKKFEEIVKADSVQYEMNLLKNLSPELKDYLKETYFISWGPFGEGFLTGSWHSKFHPVDARSKAPWWKKKKDERVIEKLKQLQENHSLVELNIKYLLNQNIQTILVGFKTQKQLEEVLLLKKEPLEESLLNFLEKEFRDERTYT